MLQLFDNRPFMDAYFCNINFSRDFSVAFFSPNVRLPNSFLFSSFTPRFLFFVAKFFQFLIAWQADIHVRCISWKCFGKRFSVLNAFQWSFTEIMIGRIMFYESSDASLEKRKRRKNLYCENKRP